MSVSGNSNRLESSPVINSGKPLSKRQGGKILPIASLSLAFCIVMAFTTVSFADDFTDYDPPACWVVDWGDWMKEDGSPAKSPGNGVVATWVQEYPYRTILFGAAASGAISGSSDYPEQGHNSLIVAIYSKNPQVDIFTFTRNSSKQFPAKFGYIRATYDKSNPLLKYDYVTNGNRPDIVIKYFNYIGVSDGSVVMNPRDWPNYSGGTLPSRPDGCIDFDFWYDCAHCCPGRVDITGIRNISSIPYRYILHCDPSGNNAIPVDPGGSSGGGSSGGGSSGGGSSGGGSSGGGSGYNPWDQPYPGGGISVPDLNVSFPSFPYIPNEDNSGERGDTWRLPQWPDVSLPFNTGDLNIPNNPVNIDGMNPNVPLFQGSSSWNWPPTVSPGDITDYPSKPSWMK